jgi:hypothetical protein
VIAPTSPPQVANTQGTADDWISGLASGLAHLRNAEEATLWGAIPGLFPEVLGKPFDQGSAYHIALAAAVLRVVRGGE